MYKFTAIKGRFITWYHKNICPLCKIVIFILWYIELTDLPIQVAVDVYATSANKELTVIISSLNFPRIYCFNFDKKHYSILLLCYVSLLLVCMCVCVLHA